MIILALDCSSTCTGWAVGDSEGNLIKYGAIWQKGDMRDRAYNMVKNITYLVRKYKVELIVYEEYLAASPKRGSHAVPEILGALKYATYPVEVTGIYPQTWRMWLQVKKENNDWKKSVKKWVEQNYGCLRKVKHNLTRRSVKAPNDTYDAVAIFLAYTRYKGGNGK